MELFIVASFAGALAALAMLSVAALILHIVDRPTRESWAPRLTVEDLEIKG